MEPIELEGNEMLTEQQRQTVSRLEKLGMWVEISDEVVSAWFRNHCFLVMRNGKVVEL